MRTHPYALHSPGEMRRLSNLAHLVEGLLLAAVGILALMRSPGTAGWTTTAWPVLLLIAGALLLFVIYPRHPISDWPAIWRDPQQRQHTLIAAVMAIAGAAELLSRGGEDGSAWAYVWPGALIFTGGLFTTHTQHGPGEAVARAVFLHRLLGATLIVAGLLRGAEIITGGSILAVLWPLAILAAAAQLTVYREPAGAYEMSADHGGHGQG